MATIELSSKKVAWLVILSLVFSLLVFLAGLSFGVRWNRQDEAETGPDDGGSAAAASTTSTAAGAESSAAIEGSPVVVEADGEAASTPTTAAVATEGLGLSAITGQTFAIQVGCFLLAEDAEVHVQDLTERGYEPYEIKIRDTAQKKLHKVHIGRYRTHAEAAAAAATFTSKEGLEAFAVRTRKNDDKKDTQEVS